MHHKILDWIERRAEIEISKDRFRKSLERHLRRAKETPLPEKLRPATADDIKVGAIIWYIDRDEDAGGPYWKYVDELLHHGAQWKAFTAEDGCRYGLDGAFVEVE